MAKLFFLILIFVLGIFAGKIYPKVLSSWQNKQIVSSFPKTKEKHVAFLDEVYDLIKQNYWDKISDEQLVNLYVLGIEKLTGKKQEVKAKSPKNLQQLLLKNINEIKEEDKKKEFTTALADIVLANLQPFGRSRLYSQKQEIDLKNNVENKAAVNHYQSLGVSKDVSPDQLKQAFEKKVSELKKEQTPQAKEKLAEVNKAYEILSDENSKKIYDQAGIEPTMEYKLITSDIFYLRLNKFSPTTLDELVRVTQKVDKNPGPTTLILDLRDNIGGAIDGLPYFLGP
ncbi:MAG: DnaJ domain-containing protein, partial [Microgenomates group bacterium]